MIELVVAGLAGLLAGVMNAVAGGGTFVTVPALIATGLPSVVANMTSTVALFPGALTAAYAYRRDLRDFSDVPVKTLLGVSLVGGAVGALLLIVTPPRAFDALIPWLMLFGSIAFAFGKQIGDWLRQRVSLGRAQLLVVQFLLGLYGGYFGGAIGLMTLAAWTVFGARDLVAMSASRIFIVGATNAVAVAFFLAVGTIAWKHCAAMLVMGVIGGYAGAMVAKKLPVSALRNVISVMNFAITAALFARMLW